MSKQDDIFAEYVERLNEEEVDRLAKMIDIRDTRVHFALNFHKSTRGEPMDFNRFKHCIDWYESTSTHMVLMGAAQVCKSEFMVINMLAASYNGCNVFCILPKYEMKESYVLTRFKKPINMSEGYRKLLGDMNSTVTIQFGKGMLRFVGANVESDFVEFAGDMYCVDETDQVDTWENVELGRSRLGSSRYKLQVYTSNPSTPDGKIHQMFLKSDQRKWMAPCTECGEFTNMDWFETVVEPLSDSSGIAMGYQLRDKDWAPGCGRDIYIKCPSCDGVVNRFSDSCYWKPHAESKIEGYHVPSIVSSLVSVTEMYEEFIAGQSDPSKMAYFYKMRLGLPFSAQGSSVSKNLLKRCSSEESVFEIFPERAHILEDMSEDPCSMGIDVSPKRLDIRISRNRGGKREAVYLAKLDTATAWDDLHNLIERYNVQCAVIDSGPDGHLIQTFQQNAKCTVWRCKYQGVGTDRTLKYNHNDMIIVIDQTEALDRGYSQLKSGKNLLPINYEHIYKGTYIKEMTALVRNYSEDKSGKPSYKWVGSKENHSRHADVYDLLAFEIINQDMLTGKESIVIF
jgi:hypothetical protein